MATTLTSKPLDFFKPDPGNPRKFFLPDEMRVLHDSLVKKQLVPLLAKPDGSHQELLRYQKEGLLVRQ